MIVYFRLSILQVNGIGHVRCILTYPTDNTSSGPSPSITVGVLGGAAGGLIMLVAAVIVFVVLLVCRKKALSGMYTHVHVFEDVVISYSDCLVSLCISCYYGN